MPDRYGREVDGPIGRDVRNFSAIPDEILPVGADRAIALGSVDLAAGDEVIVIPPGISHGFYAPYGCTLVYALTAEYDGTDEFGWYFADGVKGKANDPKLHGLWPDTHAGLLISERDLRAPRLADFKG